jgi:peptide/nickel transport system substrate-binding protein
MKRLRWQILVVGITLVVVGVLLVIQQPGEQIFVPQPTEGGVYTEGLVGSISRLNPMLDLQNPADRDVDRLLYSGLVRFDHRGVPIPDLAEAWGNTPDGTIYNFSIRGDAVWHDGEPVTVEDVVFTIDMLKSEASSYPQDVKDLWNEVEIKELDDKTIQFILPEPFAPFLDYATFPLLPEHLLADTSPEELADTDFNLAPVGTGPFKFDRLIVENGEITGIELSAFDDYYLAKPFIEKVVFHYFDTASAALAAYQQGEVLSVSRLTPDVLPEALGDSNLFVYTGRLPRMSLVFLNLKNPEVDFLQDPAVRRAMMLGTNRQYIVDKLLGGQGIVADGPVFPGTWAYYDGVEHVDYDSNAAENLLRENGYIIPAAGGNVRQKDGKALELTLLYPDDEQHLAIAEALKKNWDEIGFSVTLEAVPYDDLINTNLESRSFEAALADLNLTLTPDPDPYPFWHQSEATGGQNYSQWDDRTASEYIEQARVTTDLDTRARLYRNFQVVFDKELPSLPLYFPVYSFGVSDQVSGVQVPPLFDFSDRFSNITQWYMITRRAADETARP